MHHVAWPSCRGVRGLRLIQTAATAQVCQAWEWIKMKAEGTTPVIWLECASIEESVRQGKTVFETEDNGCKYRVNLEALTITNLSTGQTTSVRPLEEIEGSSVFGEVQDFLGSFEHFCQHAPARVRCVRRNMAGIVICVSGLPGAMGHEVSQACLRRGMTLAPVGLTGPSMPGQCQVKEGDAVVDVTLVGPETAGAQKQALEELRKQHGDRLVIIDFTHPTAVNPNSELYASAGVNFVFGTTGGDRDALMKVTQDSGVYAVIAPNMGKQIVALQATMERMAKDFPGAFSGYKLEVTESHQKTKADTSGTAKAMEEDFLEDEEEDAEALFHELKGDKNVGTTDSTKDIWDSWLSLAGEEKPPDSTAGTTPAVNGTAHKDLEAAPLRSKADVGGENAQQPVPEQRPEDDEDAMGGWVNPSFF
eukprot:s201_g13.t1